MGKECPYLFEEADDLVKVSAESVRKNLCGILRHRACGTSLLINRSFSRNLLSLIQLLVGVGLGVHKFVLSRSLRCHRGKNFRVGGRVTFPHLHQADVVLLIFWQHSHSFEIAREFGHHLRYLFGKCLSPLLICRLIRFLSGIVLRFIRRGLYELVWVSSDVKTCRRRITEGLTIRRNVFCFEARKSLFQHQLQLCTHWTIFRNVLDGIARLLKHCLHRLTAEVFLFLRTHAFAQHGSTVVNSRHLPLHESLRVIQTTSRRRCTFHRSIRVDDFLYVEFSRRFCRINQAANLVTTARGHEFFGDFLLIVILDTQTLQGLSDVRRSRVHVLLTLPCDTLHRTGGSLHLHGDVSRSREVHRLAICTR